MLNRHPRFNISLSPPFVPFTPLQLPLHSPFTPQTYMFQVAKAYLLPSKRRSFAPRKTVFYNPKHISFGSESAFHLHVGTRRAALNFWKPTLYKTLSRIACFAVGGQQCHTPHFASSYHVKISPAHPQILTIPCAIHFLYVPLPSLMEIFSGKAVSTFAGNINKRLLLFGIALKRRKFQCC